MKSVNSSVSTLRLALCAFLLGSFACSAHAAGTTTRLNLSADGTEADKLSIKPVASTDGRYVAYMSRATNLLPGVNTGASHIYLLDRETNVTRLVSRAPTGTQGNGDSDAPSISADGRFVAFQSAANNLLGTGGDTNQVFDIFVFDRDTSQIARVSVATDGQQSNFHSFAPAISANGRSVAFHSKAANLVPGDSNGFEDIFVHDRDTGVTERVSHSASDINANDRSFAAALSADGRYVAFHSRASNLVAGDTNNREDVFVYDRQLSQTQRVSVGTNGAQATKASLMASISGDGRYIAFESLADNLDGGPASPFKNVLVRDRVSGVTERISVGYGSNPIDGGSFRPHLSQDGRFVAFHSDATSIAPGDTNASTDVFLYDRTLHKMRRVSVGSTGSQANRYSLEASVVNDGRHVLFRSVASNLSVNDTNGVDDIFLHEVAEDPPASPYGITSMVSVSSDGQQIPVSSHVYEPTVSGDGRFVAYRSNAANLVPDDTNGKWDIFVFDTVTRTVTRESTSANGSQANGDSQSPRLSEDGRYLVFVSLASNLVADDTNGQMDVFLKDRYNGTVRRISIAADGSQANQGSFEVAISSSGRYVAFSSNASNLIAGDTNSVRDIFVKDLTTGQLSRVSLGINGTQSNNWSFFPSISADGRHVAFHSNANNLVAGDTNGYGDIFVFDRLVAQTSRVSVSSSGDQGNGLSYSPQISGDGQTVVFHSTASTLVPGDTNGYSDIFVHNRSDNTTELVSSSDTGAFANGQSQSPRVNVDGTRIVFYSTASNLVVGDTNMKHDVFVRDRLLNKTSRVSVSTEGEQGNKLSYQADIDDSGRVVTFISDSFNLVSPDANGGFDVFVNDRTH